LLLKRSRRIVNKLREISPAYGLVGRIGMFNASDFGADLSRNVVMAYDYTLMAGTQQRFVR
jgi:hypothetical protein